MKLNSNLEKIFTDEHDQSLIIVANTHFNIHSDKPKLAIFDLDHTLIKPRAYRDFPLNSKDWLYCY